jgi:hypothetical protein
VERAADQINCHPNLALVVLAVMVSHVLCFIHILTGGAGGSVASAASGGSGGAAGTVGTSGASGFILILY